MALCKRCSSCEVCGKHFKPETYKDGKRQRTCGRDCGVELRKREGTHSKHLKGGFSVVPWRNCKRCNALFIYHKGGYCASCEPLSPTEYYHKHVRPAKLKPLPSPRPCRECGNVFAPQRQPRQGKFRTVFCSDKCGDAFTAREARRMRTHRKRTNGRYESFSLYTIAVRDGWRCHICGKKTTRANWSLDHLIPISYGGTHTMDNVALAHHYCNAIRSNTGAAQLRLIG